MADIPISIDGHVDMNFDAQRNALNADQRRPAYVEYVQGFQSELHTLIDRIGEGPITVEELQGLMAKYPMDKQLPEKSTDLTGGSDTDLDESAEALLVAEMERKKADIYMNVDKIVNGKTKGGRAKAGKSLKTKIADALVWAWENINPLAASPVMADEVDDMFDVFDDAMDKDIEESKKRTEESKKRTEESKKRTEESKKRTEESKKRTEQIEKDTQIIQNMTYKGERLGILQENPNIRTDLSLINEMIDAIYYIETNLSLLDEKGQKINRTYIEALVGEFGDQMKKAIGIRCDDLLKNTKNSDIVSKSKDKLLEEYSLLSNFIGYFDNDSNRGRVEKIKTKLEQIKTNLGI